MREEELRRCQIREWYPTFKPYSIKTLFLPLPDSFVRYLLGQPLSPRAAAGGDSDAEPLPFLLPSSASGRDPLPRTSAHLDPISSLSLIDSDSSSSSDNDDGDNNDDEYNPSFPELESDVHRSIAELGGAIFPKMNWSAPKDAAWIAADGTLRCTSFAEIALLLRSSYCIIHDLCHALDSCSDHSSSSAPTDTFYLALRKWYPLRPEMEFRCFTRHCRLVGISQREVTGFYPVLLDRKLEIQPLIEAFYMEIVRPRFESEDYTFDIYVMGDGRIKLVDFNPWGAFTLPLLFSWEELEGEEGEDGVKFRIVESQRGVRPGLKTAVPYDYLDTGEGSGWDQFLKRADEELRRQVQTTEESGSQRT